MYDSNSSLLAATGVAVPTIFGAILTPSLTLQILGISTVFVSVLYFVFKRRNA